MVLFFPIAQMYLALPGEVWGTDCQWPHRIWLNLHGAALEKGPEWQVGEEVMQWVT